MLSLGRGPYCLAPSTFACFHQPLGSTWHPRKTTQQPRSRSIVGPVHSTSINEDKKTTLDSTEWPIYEQMESDVKYRPYLSPVQYILSLAISIGLVYFPLLSGKQQLANQELPTLGIRATAGIILFFTFRQVFLETFYTLLQRNANQLGDHDSHFKKIDEVEVHFKSKYLEGKKADMGLQLYHGFGSNLFSWKDVQPELAKQMDACVTATDLLGFGLTQRPFFWGLYSLTRDGRIGRDVLKREMKHHAEDSAKIVLVGNSVGGVIAIEETIRNPNNVEAVILISPLYQLLGDPRERKSKPLPLRIIEMFDHTTRTSILLPSLTLLLWLFQPLFFLFLRFSTRIEQFWKFGLGFVYYDKEIMHNSLDWYRLPLLVRGWEWGIMRFCRASIARFSGGRTVVDILNDRRNSSIDKFVRTVKNEDIQVLLIHGADDQLVPCEKSQQLHERLPENSTFYRYLNCGHVAHEEYPERFIEDATTFLRRVKLGLPKSK